MDPLRMANHIAQAAATAWLEVQDDDDLHKHVRMGADGSKTSKADDVLDQAALECAALLGVSALSEESGLIEAPGDLVAIIDPLDGSRNAERGIPFYCTSVAIGTRQGGLLAGVVKNLVSGDLYEASAGDGASLNGDAVAAPAFDHDEVLVAVIADSSIDQVKQEQERRGHHLRDLGSAALELCLVGTGALDAFIVHSPWLRGVDIAAGTLFVREAGGLVVDPATSADLAVPFDLDARTGIFAAGSRAAMEAVR